MISFLFPFIFASYLVALLVSNRFTKATGLVVNGPKQRPTKPIAATTTFLRQQNPLHICITESLQQGWPTILVVDSNNVRGKDDFETWNCDLIQKLATYRQRYHNEGNGLEIVYAIDHGCQPQVFDYSDGLIVFAGPHRTADDVIAQATRYFLAHDETSPPLVVVVTSDGELRQRCLRTTDSSGKYKRKKHKTASAGGIKVFGSPSLVSLLKGIEMESPPSEKSCPENDHLYEKVTLIESDIRWHTTLNSPSRQNGNLPIEAPMYHGPWQSAFIQRQDDQQANNTASIFPRRAFQELTWHRVIVAEIMRRTLQVYQPARNSSQSPLLTEYKRFYEQHQTDNASGQPVDSMFLDHRLRRELFLQQQLLQYLQAAMGELNAKVDMLTPIRSQEQLAVQFMQDLVQESPWKTTDEILVRYQNEAPWQLQTSRRQDLQQLLKRVAVREKRKDDIRPRWYLTVDGDDDIGDVLAEFQLRRGRRSERRKRAQNEHSTDEVNPFLADIGRSLEKQWLERVQSTLTKKTRT